MLTTRSRIYGWQPLNQEGDEVEVHPSRSCLLYTFMVNSDAPSSQDTNSPSSPSLSPNELEPHDRPRKGDPDYVRRPPNSFIIFRNEYVANYKRTLESGACRPCNDIPLPKMTSNAWWSLSTEERKHYEQLAEQAKLDHTRIHPNYRYQPRKRSTSGASVTSRGSRARSASVSNPDRVSKRGRYASQGRRHEEVELPPAPPSFSPVSTRKRSSSMPLRTAGLNFLRDQPSQARRAMSVDKRSFDGATTFEHPMDTPSPTSLPTEPNSPVLADIPVPTTSPMESVASSLANWDGSLSSSGFQTESQRPSVSPWIPQAPASPYLNHEWHNTSLPYSSYGDLHSASTCAPVPSELNSVLYPWLSVPTQPLFTASKIEESIDHALLNFEYGMNQDSLENGEHITFAMSKTEEQKLFEGFINF